MKMKWYTQILFGGLLVWFGFSIGVLFFIPTRETYEEIGCLKEEKRELIHKLTKCQLESSVLAPKRKGGKMGP